MSDTSNPLTALSGFFFGNDKNDPRVNPQLRQRIALAMMARGTKYPKTFGEGLSAIGEAIGDRGMQRMLEQQDLAQQGITPPPAGAGPAQGTSYAPPSDDLANAPAVKAIEAATSQPQVIPPPAPPQAPPPTPPPQAPGRGFTPVPMQPGAGEIIDPGEYNALDAADPRNRYKPAPAYLAPALERNIQDPERRGYLGQLAAKEDQTGRGVSPTGAAGPFQFTGGTGAQYGIPGNARFDPKASILAADRLTDDNVATLTAKLGREPAPGEMALAHQQGAGTAANMLTGAGNASASNLAVNNVPPGMAPGAAAQKIMGYYGMPGAGVTTPGPRDAVAAALLQQQQPPPSGRPTVADYGQAPVLAFTGADAGNGVQAAPPAPSGIRAAPPQQVAQAQPQAIPGYVPPEAKDPSAAPIIGMKPREVELRNWLVQNQNNPYAAPKVAAELQQLEQERTIRQNEANEKYKADLVRTTEQIKQRLEAQRGQAKNIADVAHVEQQTATGNIVEMPDGNKYRLDPKTGVMKPIPIEGQTNAEPILPKNEFQLKSIKHYEQMNEAEKIIGEGKALRSGPSTAGSQVPIVGGYLQTDAYRKERSAAERWVINKLRQESGATIGEKEIDREVKAYFPQPSDDAKTAADKTAARKLANEGMMEASGREGKAYLTWKAQKEAAAETARKSDVADAVQWLKDNPNDPKAAAIRKRLGL